MLNQQQNQFFMGQDYGETMAFAKCLEILGHIGETPEIYKAKEQIRALMSDTQTTYKIQTENFIDYLVVNRSESVISAFEAYQNDEAGKQMKGETLLEWEIID